jgi:hypothetical protein
MSVKSYTRRDKQRMAPDILGHYHEFVCANNQAGYERLLDEYGISGEERAELLADFKRDAEYVLRLRWRLRPKSR